MKYDVIIKMYGNTISTMEGFNVKNFMELRRLIKSFYGPDLKLEESQKDIVNKNIIYAKYRDKRVEDTLVEVFLIEKNENCRIIKETRI